MRWSLPSLVSLALAVGLVARASSPAFAQVPGPVPAAPAPSADEPAQPAPAAPVAVVAPVVKKDEGAVYPQQAIDDGFFEPVEVPMLIDIDATGAVTKVVVEKPVGHGLDEAAVAAARKLQFEPATRGGKPVAARNPARLQASRHRPPCSRAASSPWRGSPRGGRVGRRARAPRGRIASSRPTPTASGASTLSRPARTTSPSRRPGAPRTRPTRPSSPAKRRRRSIASRPRPRPLPLPRPRSEDVEEVEVHGEKPPRSVTKRTLDQREISRIPGTNGDALRSLQNLPGVGRPPGARGAAHRARVGAAGHAVLRRRHARSRRLPLRRALLGVPTEMVSRLDFYPGNFSAQFGRAMGGIVDVGLASPDAGQAARLRGGRLSSTRACSRRAPSSTRAGGSPSPGGVRTSTCGSGRC